MLEKEPRWLQKAFRFRLSKQEKSERKDDGNRQDSQFAPPVLLPTPSKSAAGSMTDAGISQTAKTEPVPSAIGLQSNLGLNDVSSGFQYQPLDLKNDEIRLIEVSRCGFPDNNVCRVACRLFHTQLDSVTAFHALSYRWGDSISARKIAVNGWHLSASVNLEAALWNLLHWQSPLVLWADALCINQNNVYERNEQVGKMRSIYKHAQIVDIWIDSDFGFSHAFDLVRDLVRHRNDETLLQEIFADSARVGQFEALASFYKHEYWHRIWVVQEIAVAKEVIVHCKTTKIQFADLDMAQQMFNGKYVREVHQIRSPRLDPMSLLSGGPELLGLPSKQLPPPDLYSMLLLQFAKKSTDPRDQIFALLGLTTARNDLMMAPDYSLSVSQVYINTARYILMNSKNLDMISLRPRQPVKLELPSWVPDFGIVMYTHPINTYHQPDRPWQASGKRHACFTVKIETKSLTVRGLCLDRIEYLSTLHNGFDMDAMLLRFHEWRKLLHEVKGDERVALCRTLTIGSGYNYPMILKCLAELSNEHFPCIKDDQLSSFASELGEADYLAKSWVQEIGFITSGRNFFITRARIIGLGPDTIKVGDMVCILLGCSLPVILRRVDNYYIYLGEVYVDEYMYGKGTEELEEGLHLLEDFELH